MAGSYFPDEWWRLSKPDYDRAMMALKTLACKDVEPGTKDVSRSFVIFWKFWKEYGLPP